MDIILYFYPAQKSYSKPEKLAGVQEIAKKSHVHVQVIDDLPTQARIRSLCSFWKPKGAIVECGDRKAEIDPKAFGSLPVVFFNHSFGSLSARNFAIRHDSKQTGELAARELLTSDYENFCYIPNPGNAFWSQERESGFRSALELNGKRCIRFSWKQSAGNATGRNRALQTFLKQLPKPCAVFAANDPTAAEVITAANMAGLAIPEDIAVLGVDNSRSICEHTSPTLSSIEPDFRRGGNLAMLMLLAVIRDGKSFRGLRQRTFGDLSVVKRRSTKRLQRSNPMIDGVLDFIRQHACDGLKASDVAKRFTCTRRMADIRFRQATGHTILDEIHAIRLERAKNMLLNAHQELKSISDFCGFRNPNSLRKFFLKETGLTLSAWREKHLNKPLPGDLPTL